jgi:hypothetical protein
MQAVTRHWHRAKADTTMGPITIAAVGGESTSG